MTIDPFSGDIYITLDPDGAEMHFQENGEPTRDEGMENDANFAALTEDGHWSEDLEPDPNKRYRGKFLKTMPLPITRDNQITQARAIESDIAGPLYNKITSEATNPVSQQVLVETIIEPISRDPFVLALLQNGENWLSQKNTPANLRATS